MLTIQFAQPDLARVRFAISPLVELWQSVRALQSPAAQAIHLPWVEDARAHLGDLDLSMLRALQPPRGCNPDFIHPPPTGALGEFEDELALMLATPPERVALEILQAYGARGAMSVPRVLQPFVDQPDEAIAGLADLLRAYWRLVLAPHWGRIRTVLEGDVFYRARQNADGGAVRLFADIDPSISFLDTLLLLDKPWDGSVALNGRGLLFIPSVFVWPALAVIDEGDWQPTIIYPARGSALLWEPVRSAPGSLAALIGARRASILLSLDAPRSTTDLARSLELLPGSVSQHLTVLHDAGLISRHRVRRLVLYSRSSKGDLLADAHHGSMTDRVAQRHR